MLTSRAQRQTRPEAGSQGKKVRIRIPERTDPEVFAGDRSKDKEGFVAWRDCLEMHVDTVLPGLADVFEKIHRAKEFFSSDEFSKLVPEYGDKPHDTEDWEMKNVGRQLYKVLMDDATQDAKKKVVGASKRDGLRRTGCSPGSTTPSPTTWPPRCSRTSSSSAGQTPRTATSSTRCSRSCTGA